MWLARSDVKEAKVILSRSLGDLCCVASIRHRDEHRALTGRFVVARSM
jgi:hypothetical protein